MNEGNNIQNERRTYSKTDKITITISAILLIGVIGLIVYFSFFDKNKKEKTPDNDTSKMIEKIEPILMDEYKGDMSVLTEETLNILATNAYNAFNEEFAGVYSFDNKDYLFDVKEKKLTTDDSGDYLANYTKLIDYESLRKKFTSNLLKELEDFMIDCIPDETGDCSIKVPVVIKYNNEYYKKLPFKTGYILVKDNIASMDKTVINDNNIDVLVSYKEYEMDDETKYDIHKFKMNIVKENNRWLVNKFELIYD